MKEGPAISMDMLGSLAGAYLDNLCQVQLPWILVLNFIFLVWGDSDSTGVMSLEG